ncbi:hypothetical protein [Fusobacterium sp.]|uniref:hypothetical protein n=1 Tax=Fusobacterium sp. TaxID=68766 RepID=UPI001DFAC8AE|nr:hypothetical protein [Fusobacterium sp.]MBS5791065.1 hypothetical protein [Fusobacterium sp.]MEE1476395.1 hypothetical protein [Fusobacterium sp.]
MLHIRFIREHILYDKLHKSIKAMVGTSIDILLNPTLLKDIKKEFDNLKRK